MDIESTRELNNGVEMPVFGLGVYKAGPGDETVDAVLWALERGYRLIDTARVYGNEDEVGQALRRTDVPREDVFVTTKLWNSDQGYEQTHEAFEASLDALGLDRVDLYLMHWPVPETRLESWRAMEEIYESGAARAIGVSNFARHHLEELEEAAEIVPAVNQFELHPFGQQQDVVAATRERDIAVQAYSPLTKARRLDDPALVQIAEDAGRTPAQVLLRWSLQNDFLVAVKSSNKSRIYENAEVFDFELTDAQMDALDELDEDLHVAWDPSDEE
jgi:diketogulonate reductase-like aldo/keto reductase